jgi:CheY-like chemotaxis protein
MNYESLINSVSEPWRAKVKNKMVCDVRSNNQEKYCSNSRYLMVVDRDPGDLFYTSMLLQRFSYKVCTAMTIDEALATARVALPALFIVELPSGMNSFELIQQVRQGPLDGTVPVIIMSADTLLKNDETYHGRGEYFLRKPVQAEDLFHVVQLAIENRPNESIRPRQHIRVYVQIPVAVNDIPLDCNSPGLSATVMSEDGMYVRTTKPFPVDARIALQVVVKDKVISLEAIVLHNHGFGEGMFGGPGMGVRFTRIKPEDKEHIRQFIEEEITKGIIAR